MLTIVRALAGLILGLVVFAGLLYLLVVVNFSQNLVESEVYDVAISDTDAYNRIYDEVLVDEALEDQTTDLLGGLDLTGDGDQAASHQRAVETLREVLPPAYLQEQTEDNIDRFTSYLRYEREDLEVYIFLEEPLGRIEAASLNVVHQYIDNLEIEEPATSGCSLDSLRQLALASAEASAQISNGQLPQSAPSLNILTRECREREFELWFNLVLDSPLMNSQAAEILEGRLEELRDPFVEGDTRVFLKAVADPLVKHLVDDAVSDIRRELQRNDRFDVLQWLADESGDATKEDIEEQAETLREVVSTANGPGRYAALAMVIVGILLMAVVHLPNPANMLRWPGITLAIGGGICLIVGFVLSSAIPGQFNDAIARAASYSADVPVSAVRLAGDLAESFARQATAGFIPMAVIVIAIGGVLAVASLTIGALSGVARRILPGSGGNRQNR